MAKLFVTTQQRFSIRKYAIGVASVLLGTAILTAPVVSADEVVATTTPAVELTTPSVVEDVAVAPVVETTISEAVEPAPESVPTPASSPVTEEAPVEIVTPTVPEVDNAKPAVIEPVSKTEEPTPETPVSNDTPSLKVDEPTETPTEEPSKQDVKVAEPVSENLPVVSLAKEEKKEEEVVVTNPEMEKGPTSARTAFRTVARNPRTLAPSGTYYFTASAGIKSEPKLSSPDLAKYSAGQSVNYDRLLTAENHQWISYISYSGHRRYIAVKELPKPVAATPTAPAAPVSQPTTPVSSQPTAPVSESGVHTFTKKSGVKSEPKLSSPDLAYYNTGDMVKYDSKLEAEGHQWISYVNYNGGRSYIEIGKLSTTPNSTSQPATTPTPVPTPTLPKPDSQPVATPTTPETVSTLPSSGVYTFTERVSIKAEPKVSSPELAFYNAGDKVKYDSTVVADGHNWISYVSYAGGRSYIAVSPAGASSSSTTTTTPAPAQPAAPSTPSGLTSPNGRADYSPNMYPVGECTWGAKESAKWAGNNWGNGGQWANNARLDGFNVGTVPVVGAIAVWPGGASPLGHVAVVTEVVSNNLIRVVESNINGKRYIADHQGLFDPNNPYTGGNVSYIYPPGR